MYTHVEFEQYHNYIQNENKMHKTWHTKTLDIKFLGISRKEWNI